MRERCDGLWPDDSPETYRRGIQDLEQICEEWADEFGPDDPLVVNLRQAIQEECQKLSSWGDQ